MSSTDTVALAPIIGLIDVLITRRLVCEVSKLFFARQSRGKKNIFKTAYKHRAFCHIVVYANFEFK
jgi:hypothetical protein